MRTTLTIDDELFAKAVQLAEPGIEKSALLRKCVKAFIQRESVNKLESMDCHAASRLAMTGSGDSSLRAK